jgi:hypothetical protein
VYLLLRRSGLWLAPMDFLPSLLSGISSSLFASDFFFFFPFLRPCNLLDDQELYGVFCSLKSQLFFSHDGN